MRVQYPKCANCQYLFIKSHEIWCIHLSKALYMSYRYCVCVFFFALFLLSSFLSAPLTTLEIMETLIYLLTRLPGTLDTL